jgi:phosphate transport system substrate-binding protein
MKMASVSVALLSLALASGCGNPKDGGGGGGGGGGPVKLTGSGSTLIKPVMDKWAEQYTKTKGGQINYQGGGSGAGINQMTDRSVDFGCTDAFMTDQQIEKAKKAKDGGDVIQIPLAMGGVVPAYNLKDVDKPLHFTAEVLAKIYLGKITNWSDPEIKELNKDVKLPDLKIAPVHRSEPSGTTATFTGFLEAASKSWQESGKRHGTTVPWPDGVGTGASGSPGVINFVKNTEGGLCYVELIFAQEANVKYGAVQNKDGHFVLASPETCSKAAAGATIPDDLRFSLVNPQPSGADSYPITAVTWAVMYVNQPPDTAKHLVDFFTWVIHDGQKIAEQEKYAPLPPNLVKKSEEKLQMIKATK